MVTPYYKYPISDTKIIVRNRILVKRICLQPAYGIKSLQFKHPPGKLFVVHLPTLRAGKCTVLLIDYASAVVCLGRGIAFERIKDCKIPKID